MILYQVGLENEYWLLDSKGKILEAPVYDFPSDEMGFLIEVRSAWGIEYKAIVGSLIGNFTNEAEKAGMLGLNIECSSYKIVTKEWQDYIARKYNHIGFENYTRNIYGIKKSHHTGFMGDRATAGCHVHFSRWNTKKERYLGFTEEEVEKIVRSLDGTYEELIAETERTPGEWEPKPYHGGFEYRSLPSTVDLLDLANEALFVVEE